MVVTVSLMVGKLKRHKLFFRFFACFLCTNTCRKLSQRCHFCLLLSRVDSNHNLLLVSRPSVLSVRTRGFHQRPTSYSACNEVMKLSVHTANPMVMSD